jgi:hypothetical protein
MSNEAGLIAIPVECVLRSRMIQSGSIEWILDDVGQE